MIKTYKGHYMLEYLTKQEVIDFKAEILHDGDHNYDTYLEKDYTSLYVFIFNAFDLPKCLKGQDYWNAIGDEGRDGISQEKAMNDFMAYIMTKSLGGSFGTMMVEWATGLRSTENERITGSELYNLMNREERSNFHDEFIAQRADFNEYLSASYESFNRFVGSAFLYRETSQGVGYWRDLSEKYSFDQVYEVLDELNIKKDGDS